MMRLDVHDLGCDMYSSSQHKWLLAPKGSGFLYVRDEVIDRLWNTIATEGWDDPKIRAERFQRIGSSNVPSLWGLRAAIRLANDIGINRIEHRHRQLCDYILGEMTKRRTESWTSPDPALRCAIATVNAPRFSAWTWKSGCGVRTRSAFAAASHLSCGSRRRTICRRKTLTGFWKFTINTERRRSWPERCGQGCFIASSSMVRTPNIFIASQEPC